MKFDIVISYTLSQMAKYLNNDTVVFNCIPALTISQQNRVIKFLKQQNVIVAASDRAPGMKQEYIINKVAYARVDSQYKDVDFSEVFSTKIKCEDHNKKLIPDAIKFSSKYRCKYAVGNINNIMNSINKQYPQFIEYQKKLEKINDLNDKNIPASHFDVNYSIKNGCLSKVSARYANSLCNMKKDARALWCLNHGLTEEWDATSSIHSLSYAITYGKLPTEDMYKMYYEKTELSKKVPFTKEMRELVKSMMQRCYFDISAKSALQHYKKAEGDNYRYGFGELLQQLYASMREVTNTYDSEIFFFESCVMIDVIYELVVNRGCRVLPIYDGIYFDKQNMNVQAIYENAVDKLCALLLASQQTQTCLSHSIYPVPFQYNTVSQYTVVEQFLSFKTLANNNAQVKLDTWHSFGSYKSEAKVAKFNADVARMNNGAKGKGIKHDSTNMKGIKHDKKKAVIAKIIELRLNNITDMKHFVAECDKLNIKRRTAYNWWKMLEEK